MPFHAWGAFWGHNREPVRARLLEEIKKADGWKEAGVCVVVCLRKHPRWEKKPILHQKRVNKKAAVYLCLKDKYPEWGRGDGGRAAPPFSAATSHCPWSCQAAGRVPSGPPMVPASGPSSL